MDLRKIMAALLVWYTLCVGAMLLGSCGQNIGTVTHEGQVAVVLSINEAQLQKYFSIECTDKLTTQFGYAPTPEDVKACADADIGKFLAMVGNIQ